MLRDENRLLKLFMKDANRNKTKTFTNKDQIELLKKYKAGSREALNTLVTGCIPFLLKRAMKYKRSGYRGEVLDLIQEGSLGLLHAAEVFDLSKYTHGDYSFLGYADLHVRSKMRAEAFGFRYQNMGGTKVFKDRKVEDCPLLEVLGGDSLKSSVKLHMSALGDDVEINVINKDFISKNIKLVREIEFSHSDRYILDHFILNDMVPMAQIERRLSLPREQIFKKSQKIKEKIKRHMKKYVYAQAI